MSRRASFVVLIGIILVIGFLFYRVVGPFLLPLFLAALLVVIFQPVHRRILEKCKLRQRRAAAITTLIVLLIVLLPLSLVLVIAAAEGSAVVTGLDPTELREKVSRARDRFALLRMDNGDEIRAIESGLKSLLDDSGDLISLFAIKPTIQRIISQLDDIQSHHKVTTRVTSPRFEAFRSTLDQVLREYEKSSNTSDYRRLVRTASNQFRDLKLELLGGEVRAWIKEMANPTEAELHVFVRDTVGETKGYLLSLGGRTTAMLGRLAIGAAITVVAMFFFLAEGPAMIATLMRLSPLDDRYEKELLSDFENVSRAMVIATLLSAIVQGFLAGVGYYLAGFESVMLMTLLTALLAMIPFVGAAAVWIPACLWLYFFEERAAAAILLAIYGAALVSSIDNVIKPMVLHGKSRLHPLLALLSVLGGMNALGPIGILVGPMLVAFLQTLLNILHRELVQFELERQTPENAAAGT